MYLRRSRNDLAGRAQCSQAVLPGARRAGHAPLDLRSIADTQRRARAARHDRVHTEGGAAQRIEPAILAQSLERLSAASLTGALVRRRNDAARTGLHESQLDIADANAVDVVLGERRQTAQHQV